jgi:hypothetical protein
MATRGIAFLFDSSGSTALAFFPAQEDEAEHDCDPVEIVGDDRAVRCAVLPSKKTVENTPASIAIFERRAALLCTQYVIA